MLTFRNIKPLKIPFPRSWRGRIVDLSRYALCLRFIVVGPSAENHPHRRSVNELKSQYPIDSVHHPNAWNRYAASQATHECSSFHSNPRFREPNIERGVTILFLEAMLKDYRWLSTL